MSAAAPLTIERLNARYCAARQADELDRLLRIVLDEALEPALDRALGASNDEICVRSVDVAVQLAIGARSERALAGSWASAMAAGIAERLQAGGPDVVRYGSRRHALVDMALGVAASDLRRAWAWRSLGLWPVAHDEAPAALAATLLADGPAVVPVLCAVAGAGDLPRLARMVDGAVWPQLAAAALRAAGAASSVAQRALAAHHAVGPPAVATRPSQVPAPYTTPVGAAPLTVRRALDRSQLAAALRAAGVADAVVAALALAEIDPPAIVVLGEDLPAALAAAPAWRDERPTGDDGSAGKEHGARPPARRVAAAEADGDPALPGGETDALAEPSWRDRPQPPLDASPSRRESEMYADPTAPAVPERARAASPFGGLVFAMHAVVALDLPAWFAAELPGIDLRDALHALALELVPAEPGDAAALAFAGLTPDREPPPPLSADAQPAIAAAAARVTGWLATRLQVDAGALDLLALMRREADVVADPGWIEIHLRLRDVDTATRRAGLDLDPGHLPFLGCVVRIVYA